MVARQAFLNVDTKKKGLPPPLLQEVCKLRWQEASWWLSQLHVICFGSIHQRKYILPSSKCFCSTRKQRRPYPYFSIWHWFNRPAEKNGVKEKSRITKLSVSYKIGCIHTVLQLAISLLREASGEFEKQAHQTSEHKSLLRRRAFSITWKLAFILQ